MVQEEGADLVEGERRQHRQAGAAAAAAGGFRLAHQMEVVEEALAVLPKMAVAEVEQPGRQWEVMAAAAAAQPTMAVVEEEQPGRWLEAKGARLLLGRAVVVAPRQLAQVVPVERWKLEAEEVLPGFSQVIPGPVGK